jgi:hypothetical protein
MILFLLLQRRVLRFMRLFAICSGALSPGKSGNRTSASSWQFAIGLIVTKLRLRNG